MNKAKKRRMGINTLANMNNHERDENITFKNDGHIYTIKHDKCPEGDKGFLSVTTFVKRLFNKFPADAIIDSMMWSKKWPLNKYYGMTKDEIKQLWSDNGTAAAEAGTKLHADIEYYYNGVDVENSSIEYEYFKKFREDYGDLKAFRTEWMIYHEELRFAGSIDMVYQGPENSLLIYDWKRVKEISKNSRNNEWSKGEILNVPDSNYWHYALQLNIYKAILVEKYNMKVGKLYLVGLHPNNDTYKRIEVKDLQKEVKELFAERAFKLENKKK